MIGGLRALREGFGDFALSPHEKITSSYRPTSNYKNREAVQYTVTLKAGTNATGLTKQGVK
jgi:hypothetical protein